MPLLSIPQVIAICLAAAIALSTPVVGWCAAARHQGQGLHALFQHVHSVDTPAEHVALGHSTELVHSHDETGTTWSQSSVFGTAGPGDGVSMLVPALMATAFASGLARVFVSLDRPASFIPAPVAPPPRSTR